jgi:beta-lactamase superfamily II metal-dependent hydrolase
MTTKRTGAVVVAALLLMLRAPEAQQRDTLDIYFVDVEGGQATLFVSPSGQSMLVDTGFPGERDPLRIVEAAAAAGVKQIDYLVTTHYHSDHVGGVAELAPRLPIRTFVDHGANVEAPPPGGRGLGTEARYQAYLPVRDKGRHLQVAPGDRVPIEGLDVRVVSSGAKVIAAPLEGAPGAGAANARCPAFEAKDEAANPLLAGENAASVGTVVQFGQFRLVNLGDLTWNYEQRLACPQNLIGTVDVYLTTHHGQDISGLPILVHAMAPRVAVMNNGAKKGGAVATFQSLRQSPGLVDLWQLHNSAAAAAGGHNAPEPFVANVDETTAHYIKITARRDGSFTVTNGRSGFQKQYPAR